LKYYRANRKVNWKQKDLAQGRNPQTGKGFGVPKSRDIQRSYGPFLLGGVEANTGLVLEQSRRK